jgi:hypothetical protein
MSDDAAPAERVAISRQALEDVIAEAASMAQLLDERGQVCDAETIRRWIVAPLAAELNLATTDGAEP